MDICHKDATGSLPAKSIIFAITHKHAIRLEETFNEMYPEHKGLMARVIDSQTERAKDIFDHFKNEDLPRIAISVDMLDTGIDVPEIMNLAFMKPVNSQIKFWQMIGRGTRSFEACSKLQWLPGQRKDSFLIVDYWENFEHFNTMPKDDTGARQIPILVSIFNTRLSKLEVLLGEQQSDDFKLIVANLRADIALIPINSFTVKKSLKEAGEAWDDEFWDYINKVKIEFLRLKVAPLLRFITGLNLAEALFTNKIERCGLKILTKGEFNTLIESVKEDVSLLPTNLPQIKDKISYYHEILGSDYWGNASLLRLDESRKALAPLMKFKRESPPLIIELGLDDVIESRKWVIVRKEGQKIMVDAYRKRIEEKIEQLAAQHPTIIKLKAGEKVNFEDLIGLEGTLEAELGTDEIDLNDDNMLKAFGIRAGNLVDFLKHILKLETLPTYEEIVRKAFNAFILEHNYNADQTRFLRTVQSVFLQTRKISEADLYEAPFSNFGMNAVEKLFAREDIRELIELTKKLIT